MLSSLTGPAVIPSGGSWERVRYSLKRRFAASEDVVMMDFRICVRICEGVEKENLGLYWYGWRAVVSCCWILPAPFLQPTISLQQRLTATRHGGRNTSGMRRHGGLRQQSG